VYYVCALLLRPENNLQERLLDKTYPNIDKAVSDIPDGAAIAFGGFFTCGSPIYLTRALARHGAKNLTIIAQTIGVGNWEINLLIENHQVKHAVCNYPFSRSVSKLSPFEQQLREGKVTCEVYPMGTFIEKLRAGAAGMGGFYTPTGVGTIVAEGKETRTLNGKEYLLEYPLRPDYAFIHAWKADRLGNVIFNKTAQNYNPEMAKSARITIVEAENVLEPGELDPNAIHLPGIFVKRVVKVERPEITVSIDKAPAKLS
jgi:3-oxoacid CoA-transferase subunit A